MTHDIDPAGRTRFGSGAPDRVDRILVAVCIGLWLAALGAGVAAIVALVGLANGHSDATTDADTPWLLYAVIGLSAAVIVGAIPLLVRARRTSSEPVGAPTAGARPRDVRGGDRAPTGQRLEPFGAPSLRRTQIPAAVSRVGFPTAALDQVWLRCTAVIAAGMGAALTGIGVGTYLLASGHDTVAWILFGLAALLTVVSPVVPVFFLRQLRNVLDGRTT